MGVILVIALAAVFVTPNVRGDELSDAKALRNEIQAQLQDSEARLNELKANVDDMRQEVQKIDDEIAAVQGVINEYQAQSDEKQKEIDKLQKVIDARQVEIDHEYENMGKRIQFMYENMGNSYVEAILTADTFADALNSVQYLMDLNEYDRTEMNKLKELQRYIKEDQAKVKQEQAEIEELKAAQEDQKAVLDDILAVKATALGDAVDEENALREANEYLSERLKEVKQEIFNLTASYDAAAGGYVPTEGSFLWPLPYPYDTNWITSPYGVRWDPWGGNFTSFHYGVDIGAPGGTPIFAVDDGQVVISEDGWNGGCGNYTVIYHGGGLYSEYMHQSLRATYVGQFVSRGEVIGYVGTTGNSTGNHLHIGAIYSPGYLDCSNRVDPSPYLGLY